MKNYILLSILLCGGNTLLAGGDDERELTLRDHSPISSTGAVVNGGEFEVVIIDPEGNPVEVEGLERVGTPDPRW
ncbi:MAG TPA: hypothetical protein QGF02_01155, partial [Candidatus Babeliales bacterium]|nr:hypothetical protein [Candidatus Babeliales bacterium]